jgi:hypothetical protein
MDHDSLISLDFLLLNLAAQAKSKEQPVQVGKGSLLGLVGECGN